MMMHCRSVQGLNLMDGPMVADARLLAPQGLYTAEHPRRFWLSHAAHVDFFTSQRLDNAHYQVLAIVLTDTVIAKAEDFVERLADDSVLKIEYGIILRPVPLHFSEFPVDCGCRMSVSRYHKPGGSRGLTDTFNLGISGVCSSNHYFSPPFSCDLPFMEVALPDTNHLIWKTHQFPDLAILAN